MLVANLLHSTPGSDHQASRKSILTSHLRRNGNHWFKGDRVFICPFLQCAEPWCTYQWYSTEHGRHVLCLHGAGNLFVEQALSKHYTKEDTYVNVDENNKGIYYRPQCLTVHSPTMILSLSYTGRCEKKTYLTEKPSAKSELHGYAGLMLTFSSLKNSCPPAHKWRHAILTSRQAWDFSPLNGLCKSCFIFRVYETSFLKSSIV